MTNETIKLVVDKTDAPEGFEAVDKPEFADCTLCECKTQGSGICLREKGVSCYSYERKDGCNVGFRRVAQKQEPKRNKKLDGNNSAYPTKCVIDGCEITTDGMTIRAQMAAMICAGMVSNPESVTYGNFVAEFAVKQADALINELNKETNA